MPPKRMSPVWKRFQLLLGLFAISVLVLSAAFIHRANDHINYVEQKHSFKPPPNEAPPGVVTCLRDNLYEHMCMRLHKRNTSCGPPVKLTPPLKLLCIDKIRTLDTCLYPNIVHFNPPMDPIPLPELRALLAEAGGAECVAGPMSLTDVVRSRYTGPLGVPRWSIYRKSCIGKYRDYTPREMLSVLYHFTQRMAAEGTLNTGIIFSGDSLVRTVMHRLLCMLRDVAHCVSEVTDLLYIVRADRDEAVNIHDWRVRMVLDVEDQEKVHLPLPHRCILAKFFPGFLPVHPPASECEEHVKGVLLAFLGIWDPDPLTPVFELHKRMPPPPISYNCFTYWSPGGNFRNRKPERMIDVFQEFHEQRYAAFYGKTSLHGRYAERAGKSPIMFYATSPRLNMTKSQRNMITRYIPTAVLEQRNTYLRHLPWTVSPNSSLPALKLDGQSPMQRYLLDFDVIWRVMSDIATRIDAAHFLCFPLEFEYSDGYFCPGLIDGIMVQWMGHIVGSELLA